MAVKVKLAAVVAQVAPWELEIEIGDRELQTRAPRFGELAAVEQVKSAAELKAIVGGWFKAPADVVKSVVDAMEQDELQAVISLFSAYAQERTKKNGAGMLARAAAAVSS